MKISWTELHYFLYLNQLNSHYWYQRVSLEFLSFPREILTTLGIVSFPRVVFWIPRETYISLRFIQFSREEAETR
jgi:hypothetical protein